MKESDRLEWIDVCKGIGIYLVVLGHILPSGALAYRFIFLFHMPLFFFLSGLLFQADVSVRSSLYKKSIRLLVPYFVVLALLGLFELAIGEAYSLSSGHALLTWGTMWAAEIYPALHGGALLAPHLYGPCWFLTCLFFSDFLLRLMIRRLGMRWASLLVVLLQVANYLLWNSRAYQALPLALPAAPAALPFLLLGYLARKRFPVARSMMVVAAAGCLISPLLLGRQWMKCYDMVHSSSGTPAVSLLFSLACVVTAVGLAQLYGKHALFRLPLAALGRASLPIMLVHLPLIRLAMNTGLSHYLLSQTLFVLSVLITALSYGIAKASGQFSITRALLLGSARDFESVFSRSRINASAPAKAEADC